jgi:phage shock protein C
MQNVQPSLFARDDTFFGICQGLGEDLGFNPDYLRITLPVLLFFNPIAAIGGYAAAGAIVFASRMLVREPKQIVVEEETAETVSEFEPMALAA